MQIDFVLDSFVLFSQGLQYIRFNYLFQVQEVELLGQRVVKHTPFPTEFFK